MFFLLLRQDQRHPHTDDVAGQAVQLADLRVPGAVAQLLLSDLPEVVAGGYLLRPFYPFLSRFCSED